MGDQEIGYISNFFSNISVAIIEITKGKLQEGDTIHIKGHTTDFYQNIESLQVDHSPVESVKSGELVGLKVDNSVREKDLVFKVIGE